MSGTEPDKCDTGQPETEIPAVLHTEDIARILRVCLRVARRYLTNGTIPSRRIGRRRVVLREEFLQALRPERRRKS